MKQICLLVALIVPAFSFAAVEQCSQLRRVVINVDTQNRCTLNFIKVRTTTGRTLTCKLQPGWGGTDGILDCEGTTTKVEFASPYEGTNAYSVRIEGTSTWCFRSDRLIEYPRM